MSKASLTSKIAGMALTSGHQQISRKEQNFSFSHHDYRISIMIAATCFQEKRETVKCVLCKPPQKQIVERISVFWNKEVTLIEIVEALA